MKRVPLFAIVSFVVASACGDHSQPATTGGAKTNGSSLADAPPEPAPREDGRLPVNVVPTKYTLAFRVTPADERFSGVTTIAVNIAEPTHHVVLHARNLHITHVTAVSGAREYYGASHTRLAHGGLEPEELVLSFADALPKGAASIAIEYDAPFDKELSGLYRVKEKDRFYAFTQFEATYARRAFPSFDEPGYKTPFDISIRAPWGLVAIANTKEIDRVADGDGNIFRFATTKPLPSYLVAFGVGDFDVREGPKTPVAIRAISVKGKQELAGLAIDATAKLTAALGDYFGIPYPYDKLDVVAIPDFAAGAMENAGFVTFREELLLLSDNAPKRQKRAQASVIAHELAHQWFGDLVTAAWWDDLFLNEGFATWMEDVAVDRVYPDFGAHLDSVEHIDATFNLDSLASTRAIRQPVSSTSEAMEAFDGITYEKGAAVLSMLEAYLGRETFQRGVRDYLTKNAWKNATAKDLIDALAAASQKNVAAIANQFLDRPGVPLVRTTLTCEKSPAKATVSFELAEWVPLGSEKKPGPTWTVPVCYLTAGVKGAECVEVSPNVPVTKELGAACPAWVHPNAEARGYYRFTMQPAAFTALAKNASKLDVPSRISILTSAWAAVRSGDLPVDAIVDMLRLFDADHERHVVGTVVRILNQMSDAVVSDAARPAFETYVRARLGGHARVYANKSKPSSDDVLGRRAVDEALATLGNDPDTLKRQDDLARAWLKNHTAVDPDAAQLGVEIASRHEGEPRFAELKRAMNEAKEPAERIIALRGLSGFDDTALLDKTFGLILSGEVKEQDIRYVLGSVLSRRTARAHGAAFVMEHWDALRQRLPGGLGDRLVRIVSAACKKDELDKLVAFVEPRAKDIEGAARDLLETAEQARLCVGLREREETRATAAFTKKR